MFLDSDLGFTVLQNTRLIPCQKAMVGGWGWQSCKIFEIFTYPAWLKYQVLSIIYTETSQNFCPSSGMRHSSWQVDKQIFPALVGVGNWRPWKKQINLLQAESSFLLYNPSIVYKSNSQMWETWQKVAFSKTHKPMPRKQVKWRHYVKKTVFHKCWKEIQRNG